MSDDGSEDSPPRPKRKIKRVVVMSSSSGSDSDENITVSGTRRKRMRVVSDGDSESSGSSVICAGTRRKRTLPKLKDSEGDSDTSGWATDHSDAPKPAPSSATAKPTSGFASDSSEGNSDKCSICLMRFTSQEVGTPQNCEHIFCLDCITEWSKNVNTCPVDRITFDSIVVRACAGGRVLRTEPVKVIERRPSVDILVVEDPTVCEICGSSENEECMLLCDGCDLGFHMQCLTPPLTEIPVDQWLCPNCDNILDVIHLSEVENLFSGIIDLDLPLGPRPAPLREPRNVRRSSRHQNVDEPSTSTGRRATGGNVDNAPTTSRGRQTNRRGSTRSTTTRRRTTGIQRRKTNRRRTKTVIIEYEVEENGKFPVTKTVKRRIKKRRVKKRQPQTAARRKHVRASVRAKLATLKSDPRQVMREVSTASNGVQELSMRRLRAGIPALSLLGNPHDLDYFSGDENDVSEGGLAVAARPTSSIISAYRQARRKMISIPSPPHASAAPDILSSILESQTLLHSRNSVVEISVDGNVNIKVQSKKGQASKERPPTKIDTSENGRIDVKKAQEDASRKAPSYPGQSRGGGGWGGGYRGTYHRENTGGPYRGGYEQAASNNTPTNNLSSYGSNGARRDDEDYGGFPRRPYNPPDENYDRRRSAPEPERRRPPDTRPGPAWQPYASGPRPGRASYGDNPLDMRIGPPAPRMQPQPYRPEKPYRPLPEPPVFKFGNDKTNDVERSEDERSDRSDSGLVIDTEKYDPMEPTNDDSGDEGESPAPTPASAPVVSPSPARGPPPPPSPPAMLQTIMAGLEPSALNVPAAVLDSAVRQVLNEHRALITPSQARVSDDDDDGDCPNFSIYSATSVHIASDAGALGDAPLPPPADDLADLVQEDDTPEPVEDVPPIPSPVDEAKLKMENEFKERVSKRCPITTNPRNPIKIKLNTHSLIKRQVTLYDEEEENEEPTAEDEPSDSAKATNDTQPVAKESTVEKSPPINKEVESSKKEEPAPEIESKDETPEEFDKDSEPPPFAQEGEDESTPPPSEINKDDKDDDKEDDGSEENSPLLEHATSPVEEAEEEEDEEDEESSVTAAKHADSDQDPDEGDEKLDNEANSNDAASEIELPASPKAQDDKGEEGIEKMTESISETEDERSYTPCLDENKSKDTSLETEKDKGIEGLDTEMISEDEGNGLFSEEERPRSRAGPAEDGEILDKRREKERDDTKKKKKKDSKRESKREAKEKTKNKSKKGEVGFKKLSKNGKERNYRDRDRDRERRDSSDGAEKKRRRKEKRKDLERYDVRTVVSEKRRKVKDAFGRDVSPRARSASPTSPPRRRRSPSPVRRSPSRPAPSPSPVRRSPTPRSASSPSPRRRRRSVERPRRRRSTERARKRRRSPERTPSPRAKSKGKRRRRARSARRPEPRRKSPKVRRRRRSTARSAGSPGPVAPAPAAAAWSPPSVDSRLLSPRTPPPEPPPETRVRRRSRPRHKRTRETTGPSKEVFTSGDNILVSVSFKDQERNGSPDRRERRERRRERRRRRRMADVDTDTARPVAIIDLERSPFRELTPSPRNVIVLSDSEQGPVEPAPAPAAEVTAPPVAAAGPAPNPAPAASPPAAPAAPPPAGPATPPEPPSSPDAYDPFEPTRSASNSPSPAHAASPPRPSITLETAQKTNLSADDVIDRRPLSPMEKVMALLQSTRDVSPEPPPTGPSGGAGSSSPVVGGTSQGAPPSGTVAPTPRIVLPDAPRPPPPKLFLAKPSPIKSDPIKPLQSAKPAGAPTRADSPYSPGSSEFGELFEPPGRRRDVFDALLDRRRPRRHHLAKVPVKLKKKGKTQVGVKIDDDNLKILDDLPSSAVEMQVKSKFLKKLNRQERVVDEVKLVLKPHYNKKHVTKDEYKDILRRAVPKICHNKSGEINPTKIQALVEAYVKKFRKKHKLGLA